MVGHRWRAPRTERLTGVVGPLFKCDQSAIDPEPVVIRIICADVHEVKAAEDSAVHYIVYSDTPDMRDDALTGSEHSVVQRDEGVVGANDERPRPEVPGRYRGACSLDHPVGPVAYHCATRIMFSATPSTPTGSRTSWP